MVARPMGYSRYLTCGGVLSQGRLATGMLAKGSADLSGILTLQMISPVQSRSLQRLRNSLVMVSLPGLLGIKIAMEEILTVMF